MANHLTLLCEVSQLQHKSYIRNATTVYLCYVHQFCSLWCFVFFMLFLASTCNLHLLNGDLWNDPLYISGATNLAISSYGPETRRPKIWLDNITDGAACVSCIDCKNFQISSLDLGKSFYALRLLFTNKSMTTLQGATVRDMVFRNISNSK